MEKAVKARESIVSEPVSFASTLLVACIALSLDLFAPYYASELQKTTFCVHTTLIPSSKSKSSKQCKSRFWNVRKPKTVKMLTTQVKQGAEAKLYTGTFLGKNVIIKERFSKKYRHPDLDTKLTKDRMRAELRGILRCKSSGIRTPAIYFVESGRNAIYMEHIENVETVNVYIGNILKHSGKADPDQENVQKLIVLAQEIGQIIGKMHSIGVIHGDLTTSNILIDCSKGEPSVDNKPELILIDFGLSHVEFTPEDKGVDLYVLERALSSTYSNIPWFFEVILEIYKKENAKQGEEVYKKLEEIRLRGRKRTMVG